jgi:aminocarboxymuconate-semialdehyde decarboxylase
MPHAPVIDIHAHFYPQAYLDLLQECGYPPDTVYSTADSRNPEAPGTRTYKLRDRGFTDFEPRIAAMDREGVEIQALSLPPPDAFARDPGLLIRIARVFNDAANAAHCAHPDRFVGLATLPVHDPVHALAELERVASLPGMRGIAVGTRFVNRDLSDPDFFPLYERIAALGWPIFLHYAPLNVIGMTDRLTRFHLANLIGNTTETAIAAAHLIFGGVLDAFPALQVCLPHSGGVLPILIGRFDRGFEVRPECRHLPHPPSHYLRRFSYDTVCHSTAIMEFLIGLVGIERIVLGSDYCFDMGCDRPVAMVEELSGLDDAARRRILGGNAARLLGIRS